MQRAAGVLCDKNMPDNVTAEIYKTAVRPWSTPNDGKL